MSRKRRSRLVGTVRTILEEAGVKRNFEEEWDGLYVHKLRMASVFPGGLFRQMENGMDVAFSREMMRKHVL